MMKKMKILCSFGGEISDGPSAGNLMYIGGTTRVIRISDDTSWQQLSEKTMAIYKQPHAIKYQLPGEDLDALVSVFCDEDLQLMMEFGDVGGSTGLEKLFSMFLFAGDSTDPQAQQSDASRASAEGKVASGSSTSDYDPPPRLYHHAALASADDRDALQVEKPIVKVEENLGAAASENEIRTVKVGNISLSASQQDIREFFSFSGDIDYVEMQSESERSQLAYVTFKDSQGADTAMLLSGATIVDLSVTVTPAENYQLPPEAYRSMLVDSQS